MTTEMFATYIFIAIPTICVLPSSFALPEITNIGGLFHYSDHNGRELFKHAVDQINADTSIFPASKLFAQLQLFDSKLPSFHVLQRVCNGMIKSGVAAIFGPKSSETASHIQSLCYSLHVPHLEISWDYRLSHELSYSINLYPHPTFLSKAYAELVEALGWKSFTIIYENKEGLVRLQELLKAHGPSKHTITIRQLPQGSDFRLVLMQIKNAGESRIVLDCSTDKIYEVLKQAQQIGMMSDYHSYFITSLDLHSVELDEFKYGGTNITAFRLFDPSNVVPLRILKDLKVNMNSSDVMSTESALLYDAVHLVAKALHNFNNGSSTDVGPLSCETIQPMSSGSNIINLIKNTEISGITGLINIDSQGYRTKFELDIIELNKNGLDKIGSWNVSDGVHFTRTYNEMMHQIVENLANKTLIVSTLLGSPYCMQNSSGANNGTAQFEGYSIELIHEISKILGFNYVIKVAPDGRYGAFNPATKEWSGMIKELLEQRADLAIADLTITSEREQVVDFTIPFMNTGISILYRKPIIQPPSVFNFLAPLSTDMWISIAIAYLGVSILLFILARLSPYERQSQNYDEDSSSSDPAFTLKNSLWFTSGSLMQQGSDIALKAISTRMVAVLWWFVTLILISSYTANLAAFRTVERMNESPISSVEDLAKQTKIQYGAVKGGSTAAFFKDSHFSTYQHIWSFMATRPSVFALSNRDGVERVRDSQGGYAFFMESTTLEYVTERECDLTRVGEQLNTKAFGIALPKNSPYKWAINKAILTLQESGKLHLLKNKWWKQIGARSCVPETATAAYELGIADLGGLYVVLLGGMMLSCIIAVCEFIWKKRSSAK